MKKEEFTEFKISVIWGLNDRLVQNSSGLQFSGQVHPECVVAIPAVSLLLNPGNLNG